MQLLGPGDLNNDGHNDLVAVRPDGVAYLYRSAGNGHHGTRTRIALDWDKYNRLVAVEDFTGDGAADLVARKHDGTLWLLAGSPGATEGGFIGIERKIGSGGWNMFRQILGPGDFNSDARADMLGIDSQGYMWFYEGTQFRSSAAVLRRALVGTL
jgi:hypothetical protein